MADLHYLVQNEDETPQQYLARFMEVMNMIYDADSIVSTGSFIKGLQPGSMLFEDLIKNTPYDMAEIRMRAEGVFRVLESREKLSRKVTAISVEKVAPRQNKRSYPQSSLGWNKRQKNDSGYNRQPRQSFRIEVPHFELNCSLERIFMENREKNIFRPLAKIMVPENMRDKSHYCAHHEDFGHLTNDCRNLYGQVMFTIKSGGLQQYVKKVNGTPRMVKQSGPSAVQKGKAIAKQRTPVAE